MKLAPTQPIFSSTVLPLQQSVVSNKVTSFTYEATKVSSSATKSEDGTVSMDETMSSCDSYKSPQVEYIDNEEVSAVVSIERKALSNLYITPNSEITGKDLFFNFGFIKICSLYCFGIDYLVCR